MVKYISPTNDLAFKKVFGSDENIHILKGFINDFFGITPEYITLTNPYNIQEYRELLKGTNIQIVRQRTTISDISATMDLGDYTSELQMRKEAFFTERSIYYPLAKYTSRYSKNPIESDHLIGYERLKPIYAMNVLGYIHFPDDEDALRVFELYDPVRKKSFPNKLLNFGYFELLKPNIETDNQREWRNFFLKQPLSTTAPDYIKQAEETIKIANMKEEELEMMSKIEYAHSRFYAEQHYALTEARDIGKEEGIEIGREEGREEGIEIGVNKARNEYQPALDHLKAEVEELRRQLAEKNS
jgi:predicted transposase/invertase (TIGR01784 family)